MKQLAARMPDVDPDVDRSTLLILLLISSVRDQFFHPTEMHGVTMQEGAS